MTSKEKGKLTDKQEAFCNEYLIDLNATQAAIRAGYSEDSARLSGHRNITNDNVQERLAELKLTRSERVQIDADYVLQRHLEIDRMDVLDIMNDDGSLLPIREWPKVWRQYISGVELSELFEHNGDEKVQVGILKKIKWPDKTKNLEMLGKHTSVMAYKEVIRHEANEDLTAAIFAARKRTSE